MAENTGFPELGTSRVLLLEDDPDFSTMIEDMLQGSVGSILHASTHAEAQQAALSGEFDIAIIDVNLPDGNGLDFIGTNRNHHGIPAYIVISGEAGGPTALRLEQLGIETLLTKPFTRNQLQFSIYRELLKKKPHAAVRPARPIASEVELIGTSDYIQELRHKIGVAATGRMPVLITGPTGSGKEVVARAIHAASSCGLKPMISVNSAAIPEHLEESEFFGYARGAFTGAQHSKDGLLKCAHGSSLFLDEVGELSLRMQAKLLRVLDNHDFFRVGDTTPVHSEFRLISATNRSLTEMVRQGLFREDLYFRICACVIETEPLGTHTEDIAVLVNYFLERYNREHNRLIQIEPDAMDAIRHYAWPGNVRELKNAVASLCMTSNDKGVIRTDDFFEVVAGTGGRRDTPVIPFSEAKNDFERNYYQTLLQKFDGNISQAARASGIERAWFSKRVKSLGLSRPVA